MTEVCMQTIPSYLHLFFWNTNLSDAYHGNNPKLTLWGTHGYVDSDGLLHSKMH